MKEAVCFALFGSVSAVVLSYRFVRAAVECHCKHFFVWLCFLSSLSVGNRDSLFTFYPASTVYLRWPGQDKTLPGVLMSRLHYDAGRQIPILSSGSQIP